MGNSVKGWNVIFNSPLLYLVIAAHLVHKVTHCSESRLREGTIICDAQIQEDKWKMMFRPNFGVFLISLILNESFNVTSAGLSYNWVSLLDFSVYVSLQTFYFVCLLPPCIYESVLSESFWWVAPNATEGPFFSWSTSARIWNNHGLALKKKLGFHCHLSRHLLHF